MVDSKSTGGKELTGNLTHNTPGKAVGNCGDGSSSVGEVVATITNAAKKGGK